jgi:hypothetical protein
VSAQVGAEGHRVRDASGEPVGRLGRIAASLISTVADLNRVFGLLLAGETVSPSSPARTRGAVPVVPVVP